MKQLEDSKYRVSPGQTIFEKVLNHSDDLLSEWSRDQYKQIWLGHVYGTFTFYYNGKKYMFDSHPASSLYEVKQVVDATFTVPMSISTVLPVKLIKG